MNEKTVAKNAVSALTREIEWLRKETEHEQTNIMNLVRDRDMAKKGLSMVEEQNIKNRDEMLQVKNELKAKKDETKMK